MAEVERKRRSSKRSSDVRREPSARDREPAPKHVERVPAHPRHASAAGHAMAGDEVLEEIGSRGVPKRAMHAPLRTPDDEVLARHRAHEESAVASFHPDPELGDAAADLAEELGRSFVESATRVSDVSEIAIPEETAEEEVGGPFVVTGPQSELGREAAYNLRDVDEKSRRRPGK